MATLGFSTKWPRHMGGGDTDFIAKIWQGLFPLEMSSDEWVPYIKECRDKGLIPPGKNADECLEGIIPKLHTMRKDPKGLWVPGKKIHMVVFNRTKNRFQFAPVLEVKSTQEVSIKYKGGDKYPVVTIDNKRFTANDRYGVEMLREIAFNDGFNSMDHFFMWFNTNDTYKLIQWTDLKY
ncbi:MAG: hypothetical protein ACK5HT_20170 [Draconibacterium sp.]